MLPDARACLGAWPWKEGVGCMRWVVTVKAVEFERLADHPQKPVDCRRKQRSVVKAGPE